ncbi:MAG: hypothetical protein K0R63_476 [Rickettsiales bacterium]|jgi:hypothetical protein|nr:hypothetical protein [Rickettsiales bacterium]
MLKKLFKLIPLSPVITMLGLGKIEFGRNVWLSMMACAIAWVVILACGLYGENIFLWGAPLAVTAFTLFVIGTVVGGLYRLQGNLLGEMVIDRVGGIILMICLCLPWWVAAYSAIIGALMDTCTKFLMCGVIIPKILSFCAVFPLPFVLYHFFLEWAVWPRDWLERNMMNSSIGAIVDDIFIPIYIALILILVSFFPMKLDIPTMVRYYEYTFLKSYITIKNEKNYRIVKEAIEESKN